MKKILLIGIGNSGRGDDGLGWKLAEKAEALFHDVCDVEYRYQLQVEEADLISKYDFVIFVDATHDLLNEGFEFRSCARACEYFFSSHIQSPETILYLADVVFDKQPIGYLLLISGKEWELRTAMSKKANKNLQAAISFLTSWMKKNLLQLTKMTLSTAENVENI